MKTVKFIFHIVFIFGVVMGLLPACAAMKPVPQGQPCVMHEAITFSPILVKVTPRYGYTTADGNQRDAFMENVGSSIIGALQDLDWESDKYRLADGVEPNLIFDITFLNDTYDHFGATVVVYGLGEGYLFTVNIPMNYLTAEPLYEDMAKEINAFVVNGWYHGDCGK